MKIFHAIIALLDERRVTYRLVHHQQTFTSQESADARGESVEIGGKSLLMKINDEFKLFVLSGARKLDSKKIKERFNTRETRFATKEELMELTGLVPGSVPPFGRPILPFDLFLDDSIAANEKIAFNAGSLTDSIIMNTSDYRTLITAEQFSFSQPK